MTHGWLPNKKQKRSQKSSCLRFQTLSCILVLNTNLPSGVHLPCQEGCQSCCFNWLGFGGQTICYNWRSQNHLMLFSYSLNEIESNNKTSESWPCCLLGSQARHLHILHWLGHLRIRAAHRSACFISLLSDIKMPVKRKLSQVINHHRKGLFFQVFLPGEGRGKYHRSLGQASLTWSAINYLSSPLPSPKWADITAGLIMIPKGKERTKLFLKL